MILCGPPGCGKTSLARLLAERTRLAFEPLSATSGRSSRPPPGAVNSAGAPSCSSTRSTASTAPSRTASCRTPRTAPSSWSARRPRTRVSNLGYGEDRPVRPRHRRRLERWSHLRARRWESRDVNRADAADEPIARGILAR
ncbi:AAA family ATPase [Streptomyces niveiscabiei]|nr:AAA family ATPase [Streptomyces niveiscabiei]